MTIDSRHWSCTAVQLLEIGVQFLATVTLKDTEHPCMLLQKAISGGTRGRFLYVIKSVIKS